MRALLLLACSGCIIGEPQGAPQWWTPQLGGTVEDVVAGDLDADGATDIVVMMSGTVAQAGLYLLDGDVDLQWNATDNVLTFSRFVPMPLVRPVGAYLEAGAAPSLYLATGEELLTVTQLSNTLETVESTETTVGGSGVAWVRPIAFPGNQPHTAISNGSSIDHVEADLGSPRPLPAPDSPTWDLAQTVTSYTEGSSTFAVVATAATIYRAMIPTTPGSPFAWQAVRTGAPWLGQTAHDFDGDGRAEIVGFDLAAHKVCVVDIATPTIPVAAPSCIQLSSTFTGTDVTIIAGQNLSMDPALDLLVIQASGTETNYSLADGVAYANGSFTAASDLAIPFPGPARGHSVIATPGLGIPVSVLTFGADGTAVCALGPC